MLMIQLYHQPSGAVADGIVAIARLLSPRWFTPNIPDDTRRDLLFQNAWCISDAGEPRSFLVFTSWDGALHITVMGTHPDYHGRGYRSQLTEHF